MALFLRQGAYGVGEGERIDEVPEGEGPLEASYAISLQECPIGDLRMQRSTLLYRDSGGSPPAGLTLHVFQFPHIRPTPDLVEAPCDPERRYTQMAFSARSVAR